ncbi:uncharacterized protein LOC121381032 isoform X1 [Gigantopelta aegis]|uniref:uncharacterized protein LOC121381032 isoform X1 n=1 Tax=Gigantopelta aegis TaxID=1735272 RepID=UPI001B887965|nr:uncharacterized protein LOC121381032 isoform X1 [Gigantopelta aegis]
MSANKLSYLDMTISQLKDELRKRNARLSGRKRELITRLEFLDNCQSAGAQVEPESEFSMTLPPSSSYKDLHGGMTQNIPNVTVARLKEYLDQFSKNLDEKIKDLYKERFLRCLRVAHDEQMLFVSSTVWAEMRKSTSYKVDVSLNSDGVIQEAQCECGAGQGPAAHCKHVATVVFALTNFCQTGEILTELTCTQVLQTFHKSKVFKGSPLKSSQLQAIRSTSKEPAQLVYDPRPVHLRNRIESRSIFRNACLNLTTEPEISEITAQQADDVERLTRGQGQSKAWRETRLLHITSSNFGTICKATDRRNMESLANSLVTNRDLKTQAILHGRKYEQVAVEKFELKWGMKTEQCGLFICKTHPHLAASPDRMVDDSTLLEIKCPYTCRNKHISPLTVPYLKEHGGRLKLDANHDYYYQIQGQLLCTNRKVCLFVVYTFFLDIVLVRVERDDEFIRMMLKKLHTFYTVHFQTTLIKKFMYRNYYHYTFD